MLTVEDIVIAPPEGNSMVDPMSWFRTPGPFELEIGCGKGGFLVSRASANPDIRMLGIEWANKFYKFAADRMARRGISNVHVMRTDAKTFVMRNLPAHCVDVLHLYHPDPWPKKRHHKRRLVQSEFIAAAAKAMKQGGLWLIQSDHAEYFADIQSLLSKADGFRAVDWDDVCPSCSAEWQGTNYEIKYAREGRVIHRCAYRRIHDGPALSSRLEFDDLTVR